MTDPAPTGVGAEIRRIREELKLSQKALARRFGVSQPTISQWETNAYAPPPYLLVLLKTMSIHIRLRQLRAEMASQLTDLDNLINELEIK